MEKEISFKMHNDDEWFDEIRIEQKNGYLFTAQTIPRWKESELSGDEWRTSTQWYHNFNGQLLAVDNGRGRDLQVAVAQAYPGIYEHFKQYHNEMISSIGFYRKGKRLYQENYKGGGLSLLPMLGHLPLALIKAGEESGGQTAFPGWEEFCFQPGCMNKAVSTYQLRAEYDDYGREYISKFFLYQRRFCKRHLERGDCGFEDADRNYIMVS